MSREISNEKGPQFAALLHIVHITRWRFEVVLQNRTVS